MARTTKSKVATFLAAGMLLFAGATSALATEGGGGAYPNGAEGFGAGMLPPPGTYFINYLTYYTAQDFNDQDGDAMVPGFDLKVWADSFRFIRMTEQQLAGGTLGLHMIVPVVNVDVKAAGASDTKSGVGDITVGPVVSWHGQHLHQAVGVDVVLPTGRYDERELANIGRNYLTIEPIYAVTWMNDNGCEASAKFMYDINSENDDTNYRSGQEFHIDYTLAHKFGALSAGVGGYYYKQTTDDELNNRSVDDNRGQALAVGPQLKYDYRNMFFIAKYQKEMAVENRPEGDKFWFKMLYAF